MWTTIRGTRGGGSGQGWRRSRRREGGERGREKQLGLMGGSKGLKHWMIRRPRSIRKMNRKSVRFVQRHSTWTDDVDRDSDIGLLGPDILSLTGHFTKI